MEKQDIAGNKKLVDLTPSPIQTAPTKKKIGFVSAILLVVGSSIGSGIFIKNHEILNNVHGAIVMAILSWVIAIVGILALAMALPEICSGAGTNNQGLVGWVRRFNNKFFYNGAKNFMTYLHLPIYYFILPLYMIMTLQESFGFSIQWYYIIIIALAIASWFIWVSGLSAKAANIQNWVVTCIKFLPLAFAAIAGFVMVGLGTGGQHADNNFDWTHFQEDYNHHLPLFVDKLPFIGVMSSIPAVFFAFDGFYSAAGIQTEMKEPKKVSMALAVGIAIVSAIDVLIAFSFLIGTGTGKLSDLHVPIQVIQVANVLVTVGILGVINGVAIYSSRYYEDLVAHNEIPFAWKWKEYVRKDKPLVGTVICYCITLFWFVIFTIIGLFYINSGHYDKIPGWDNVDYGPTTNNYVGKLYSFADLIGNWNAVMAFACIIFAVIGAIINRKTKQVKVEKSKTFLFGAIVSAIIVTIGLSFVIIDSVGNFVSIWDYYKYNDYPSWYLQYLDQPGAKVILADVIGSALQMVVMVIFMCAMFIPAAVKVHLDKKRGVHHHSHKAY